MDLTTPFQLKDISSILNHKNLSKKYIKLVSDANKNTTTQIRIKQEDSLSPRLFTLILDQLVYTVKNLGLQYRMGQQKISSNGGHRRQSAKTLQTFHLQTKRFNMKVTQIKTEAMAISKEPLR